MWTEAITVPVHQWTTADWFLLSDHIEMNAVDLVMVKTFDESFNPVYDMLFFTQHGLINGTYHVLVPLTEQSGSVFNQLGMVVSIDISGRAATVTRGRTTLSFSETMIGMFVDRETSVYLPDMPIMYNGTLYVPFEPMLDAFGIPWIVEYNVLTIGG
jgi:hypothetical protein